MKKKLAFLSLALMMCIMGTFAQVPYYGSPFYKEGFDFRKDTLSLKGWVQSGTSYNLSEVGSPTDTAWSTDKNYYSGGGLYPATKNFKYADGVSVYSLLCSIPKNTGLVDTLTSPIITNTEAGLICIGFSYFESTSAANFPAGFGYMSFQISKDNGATWAETWRSNGQTTGFQYLETPLSIIPFAGWKNVRVSLPDSYNGQNLKIRFCINSKAARESAAFSLLIDGVFASPLRTTDAKMLSINNFSTASSSTNKNGYLQTPITVKVINEGSQPVSSINLNYKVSATGQPDQLHTETYNLTTPAGYRDTISYIFNAKANLALSRTTYTLQAWSSLTGELYTADDSIQVKVENTMTDIPYIANWASADEWKSIPSETTKPKWEISTYNRNKASVCDGTLATITSGGDAHYFSRPLHLKAGKTYEMKFTAITKSDSDTNANAMQIYWTTSVDTSVSAHIGDYLFTKNDIKNEEVKTVVYVTPAKDSIYYLVFKTIGKKDNKPLYLYDVAFREAVNIDTRIMDIKTPEAAAYKYTSNDSVTIFIGNTGLQPIAAGALKVYYQLDNSTPVEATVSKTLAQKENIVYTFTQKLDLSALKSYTLKAWVSLVGDEASSNDTLTKQLIPALVELPYDGNLGTIANRTYEENYWTKTGGTTTYYWMPNYSATDSYWSYGGTRVGQAPTVPSTLFSRPMHIAKGTVCNVNYALARNSITVEVPFKVGIYTKVGDTFTLVQFLNDTVINTANNVYTTYKHSFIPTVTNDYYVGFTADTTGLQYGIYNKVNLKDTYFGITADLGVASIASPTTSRQCSGSTAITVRIKNYGTSTANGTSVSYKINNDTIGVTEKVMFNPALDGGATVDYTFKQRADLGDTITYKITTYTHFTTDTNSINDTTSIIIPYQKPMQYGDTNNPVQVSPFSKLSESPNIGLLNDGSAFVPYWHSSGNNKYNLHLQYLDPRGVAQWDNERLISDNSTTFAIMYGGVADKQGNYILCYSNLIQTTETQGECRISKVNTKGEYLFGQSGKLIIPQSKTLMGPRSLKTDSKGNIYAALGTAGNSSQNAIYKINGKTGEIMASIPCNVAAMEIDKKDNLYVAILGSDESSLQLQVYNSNLQPLHTQPATVASANVRGPAIVQIDKSGGAWVCYFSELFNNTYFVQYVNSQFQPTIAGDGVPVSNNQSRYRTTGYPVIMEDQNALAFAFNETTKVGNVYDYIKGQIIKQDGTLLKSNEGEDIVVPINGGTVLKLLGLDYHNSQLVLNYNYWKGTGSMLRTAFSLGFYDNTFSNPIKVDYVNSIYDAMTSRTVSDNYGIYTVWKAKYSSDSAYAIRAQHVYFDKTMVNKTIYVKVNSAYDNMGYATGGGLLNMGDTATVEAVPVPGFEFVEWQTDGIAIASSSLYKFAVNQNVTLTAVFRALPTYAITATASTGGIITPSGEIEVFKGSNQTFTFTANEGYEILEVLVDGISRPEAAANGYYLFTNVTKPHTINVEFQHLDIKSVDNSIAENTFSISPNPVKTNAKFTLHTGLKAEELKGMTVKLYDMNGRLQMNPTVNSDLTFTAPAIQGVYIVQIISNKVKKEVKLVVVQ